jgi:hypothetical protein
VTAPLARDTATTGSPGDASPTEEPGAPGPDHWWERMRSDLQSRPEQPATADPRPSRPHVSHPRRTIALFLLVLTVAGLVLGLLVGARLSKHVASAQVDAGPGSTLDQQLAISADQANRYVQTQVLFVSDPATASAVERQLGLDAPPTYTVRQVGTTSILEISSQASNVDDAVAVTNAVAKTYISAWRTRTGAELAKQLDVVTDQLAAVTAAIDDLSGARTSAATQAKLTALSAQSQQLLLQQSDLKSSAAAVSNDNRVVTLADATFATSSLSAKLTAVVGALVGLLAGIGYIAWARRRT